MIVRSLQFLVTGIAVLYGLELTGTVPTKKYFPNLPRLEKSAVDLAAWADSARWGVAWVGCMSQGGQADACTTVASNGHLPSLQSLASFSYKKQHTQMAYLDY